MILWVSEGFSCNELVKLLDKENPEIKQSVKSWSMPLAKPRIMSKTILS